MRRNEIITSNEGIFTKLSLLNFGAYGKVYLVKDNDDLYALKKQNGIEPYIGFREISCLAKVKNHPSFIKLLDYKLSLNSDLLNLDILMDFYPTTLEDFVIKDKHKFMGVVKQLIYGLQYLEKLNIIHRDIKPSNILYNDVNNTIKIIDFGLAKELIFSEKMIELQNTPQMCTLTYRAPEIFFGKEYDVSSDMWSFGMVLFKLYTGEDLLLSNGTEIEYTNKFFSIFSNDEYTNTYIPLIYDKNKLRSSQTFENILEFKVHFKRLKRLLKLLLVVNPKRRIKASQIRKYKERNLIPERLYTLYQENITFEIIEIIAEWFRDITLKLEIPEYISIISTDIFLYYLEREKNIPKKSLQQIICSCFYIISNICGYSLDSNIFIHLSENNFSLKEFEDFVEIVFCKINDYQVKGSVLNVYMENSVNFSNYIQEIRKKIVILTSHS